MHKQKKLQLAEPVSCTERGPDPFLTELRKRDPIPHVPDEHAKSIYRLRNHIKRGTLDGAINQIREHSLFRECFAGRSVMILQIRNATPSDVSAVYRHEEGEFSLQRMMSVSLKDPVWPLMVHPHLLPATDDRNDLALRRKVFGLHELADVGLFTASTVFRSIFSSVLESWFSIIVKRNAEFTWVLTLWCRLRGPEDIQPLRAGLEKLAGPLARLILKQMDLNEGGGLILPDSLHRGLLVLDSNFKEVRRQNYATESMMKRFKDASDTPMERWVLHENFAREYSYRKERRLDTAWQIDEFGMPCASGVVALDARPLGTDVLIRMTELVAAPPEKPLYSGLDEHGFSGLATAVKNERKAFYVAGSKCVARPLIGSDLIGDRIHRYPTVSGTELVGKKGQKSQTHSVSEIVKERLRREGPMSLQFRDGLIVGVLIPV
jgi:hypothetical protein